ncbi:MAG: PH domain-containing protein [Anaerolineaceae bacterium]|nr:PH domain-containing protein [Anaerolineaceae bacterium]
MAIDTYQAKVKSNIWKAIAQSGLSLNTIPMDDQNKFVDQLTDNILVMVNEMLQEVPRPESASKSAIDLEHEEMIIWEGRPFLSLVENYTLTNERIKIITGLLGKDIQNYELIRVQDIDITQNVSERMLGIGDIVIKGADQSSPTIVLRNIHDPQEVYELLRKAWLAARKKYGLIFREEM